MYFKLYIIWHCDFVEKKRNLNENAKRMVFSFEFLRKLHFYNRGKVAFSNRSSWKSLENCIFTLQFFISTILSFFFSFFELHINNTFYLFYQTLNFILKKTFSKHSFYNFQNMNFHKIKLSQMDTKESH